MTAHTESIALNAGSLSSRFRTVLFFLLHGELCFISSICSKTEPTSKSRLSLKVLDLDLFLDQKWMSVASLKTTGRIMSTCKSCHSFFFAHLFILLCVIHIPSTVNKLEAAPLFLLITWVMMTVCSHKHTICLKIKVTF